MNGNSERLRSLYQKLQSKDLTRAERRDIMEEVKLEQYKLDKRKPISQKGQAVCCLVSGLLIICSSIVSILTSGKPMHLGISGADVFYIVNFLILAFIVAILLMRKSEPADELSKELMYKATTYASFVTAIVMMLIGVIVHILGNNKFPETYSINSDGIRDIMFALVGAYLAAKYAIYLWLDRTPADDE